MKGGVEYPVFSRSSGVTAQGVGPLALQSEKQQAWHVDVKLYREAKSFHIYG